LLADPALRLECYGNGVHPQLCPRLLTPTIVMKFLNDVVYSAIRMKESWKVAHELLMLYFREIARPNQLVCCWGSAEFEFLRAAGRKAADGSDGFDVRECILQVLPRMRNLTHTDDTCRFSLSMNLLRLYNELYHEHHPHARLCTLAGQFEGEELELLQPFLIIMDQHEKTRRPKGVKRRSDGTSWCHVAARACSVYMYRVEWRIHWC